MLTTFLLTQDWFLLAVVSCFKITLCPGIFFLFILIGYDRCHNLPWPIEKWESETWVIFKICYHCLLACGHCLVRVPLTSSYRLPTVHPSGKWRVKLNWTNRAYNKCKIIHRLWWLMVMHEWDLETETAIYVLRTTFAAIFKWNINFGTLFLALRGLWIISLLITIVCA